MKAPRAAKDTEGGRRAAGGRRSPMALRRIRPAEEGAGGTGVPAVASSGRTGASAISWPFSEALSRRPGQCLQAFGPTLRAFSTWED